MKILIKLLLITVTIIMLVACGHNPDENVTPLDMPEEKETVTLMVMQLDMRLKERVTLFNETNPDYNIEVISYIKLAMRKTRINALLPT